MTKTKKFKCSNDQCNCVVEFNEDDIPVKFVCPKCGIVNTPDNDLMGSGDSAGGCLQPEGFEWRLPVGVFDTPEGTKYATADDGTLLTREEWRKIFGSDPVIAKAWMREMGIKGKPGYVNLSTLGRKQE
jgi:hypothetical protein